MLEMYYHVTKEAMMLFLVTMMVSVWFAGQVSAQAAVDIMCSPSMPTHRAAQLYHS
jgi:hypothetical protein